MRLCSGAGCGRAVPDNVRHCHECAAEHEHEQKKTRVERGATDPIMLQYGTARWQKFRRVALARFPFCECKAVAVVADHNIPARLIVEAVRAARLFPFDEWAGFYVLDNIRGRCHSCHNAKTRTEDSMDWTDELARILSKYRTKSCGLI